MGALDEQARRLEVAAGALLDLTSRIHAGVPWPLADAFGAEPEASWGPLELLAHVEEFLPYWMGEIERILAHTAGDTAGDSDAASAGARAPFGRAIDDPLRTGVIGRDRTLPLRELTARIAADASRVSARLRELDEAEAGRIGVHPRRGEMTVREMLEPFVVGHLEGHVMQLREILAAAGI